MNKRHGLVILLFCISILVGITIAVLETVTAFFFSTGIPVLPGIAAVFFAAAILGWRALKKKIRTRDPERSVRYQGKAFGTWFAAHNLFWTLVGSISIWGVFKLFGYKPWVVLFSAGALACACFAFLGILFIPQRKMLGLCWQSPVPDGLEGFWDRAGASVVLRDRYEYAAEHDQKKSSPLLWSISRVFERSTSGGADRGIDLMETQPGFLSTRLKKEGIHRMKVLSVLFWVTVVLAALPGLLGIVPHYWGRFPGNWPSDKIKKSDPEKSPMMASESQPDQSSRENQTRDKDRQPGQDQEKSSNSESKQDKPGETGQSKQAPGAADQTSGTSDQDKSNREQDSKEGSGQGPGDSRTGGSNREQNNKDQKGEGKTGQPSTDSAKDKKEGSQSGGTGQDKTKAGQSKTAQEGKGSEGKSKEPGQGQGKEPGGSDARAGRTGQEQKGPGKGESGDQKSKSTKPGQGGAGQDQEGKSSQGKGKTGSDSDSKGKGEGECQAGGKAGDSQAGGPGQGQKGEGETGQSGKGQDQEGKSGQGKSEAEGKGKGQGESQGGGKTDDSRAGRTGQGQKDEGKPGKGGAEQDQGSKSQVKGKTQSDNKGKGKGEGQGSGSADAVPGMKDEPEPLPRIPSRATKMVDLELPTLTETPTKGSESGDAPRENTPGQLPGPKGKAPTEKFKTGEQERPASKPEQYLPNWILNIIKKSHELTHHGKPQPKRAGLP